MTANGHSLLVPKLRFPEFAGHGPWEAKPLYEYCERLTETVGDCQLTPVSISAGKGFVPQSEKFGRDISGAQYSKYIRIQRGDFAYNRGNSKRYPQGCVCQLVEFDEAAASNAFYCFRLNAGCEPAFFRGVFEKNTHGRQLLNDITSGARSNGLLNISADAFYGILIPMPKSTAEQQKIANCLGSLDDLIAAEYRKLETLRQHRKGMMQRLFPQPGKTVPQLRFPEFHRAASWRPRLAGSLFTQRAEKGEQGLPIYSVTIDSGMVERSTFERNFYDIEDAAGNKRVCKDDIAYNTMRMWQGACGVAPVDCMVSPAYVVLAPSADAHSRFFEYLFKTAPLLQVLTGHSRGLTKDRLRLYYEDFAAISLVVPERGEQIRIADCLSSHDRVVSAQEARFNALCNYKQGMLQRLFPDVSGE